MLPANELSHTWMLSHLGRDLEVRLDDRGLELVAGTSPPARIELEAIRSVRIARLGSLEMCVLGLGQRREHTLSTDEPKTRPAFTALVRALYPPLTARGVPFVAGSSLLLGLIVVICVVTLAVGLGVYLGILDAPAFRSRGLVLAIVSLLGGPVIAWRARPKPISSEAQLVAVLPKG